MIRESDHSILLDPLLVRCTSGAIGLRKDVFIGRTVVANYRVTLEYLADVRAACEIDGRAQFLEATPMHRGTRPSQVQSAAPRASALPQINAAGGKAMAVQADVRRYDSVKAMFAQALAHYGRVHAPVNHAGAAPSDEVRNPVYETGPEVWKASTGVNLDGFINCTAALPEMIERKLGRPAAACARVFAWSPKVGRRTGSCRLA